MQRKLSEAKAELSEMCFWNANFSEIGQAAQTCWTTSVFAICHNFGDCCFKILQPLQGFSYFTYIELVLCIKDNSHKMPNLLGKIYKKNTMNFSSAEFAKSEG